MNGMDGMDDVDDMDGMYTTRSLDGVSRIEMALLQAGLWSCICLEDVKISYMAIWGNGERDARF